MKIYEVILINPVNSSIIKKIKVECTEVKVSADNIIFSTCSKIIAIYPSKITIVKFISETSA